MKIQRSEFEEFANDPRNRIDYGQCARNTYKFYKSHLHYGVKIYYGSADYYRDNKFISKVPHHYWCVIMPTKTNDNATFTVVDIYNFKLNINDEYRNHTGQVENFEDFQQHIESNYRILRQSLLQQRQEKKQNSSYLNEQPSVENRRFSWGIKLRNLIKRITIN